MLLTEQNLTISGTRVTSTRPVSVISGDLHPAQNGSGAKDSAIDHLVPTDLAGSEFVVANLADAASYGNVDSDSSLGVGNRYVQLIAVDDNSEVSQYDASGDLVRVITFEQAGDVKVYHLPGSAGTGYFFRATNVTPGYQANDFLMFVNSSADTSAEMAGTQLPALRSVQSEGDFCSGSRLVEYRVPSSPTSFFVYLPINQLSSLEVDNGDGAGFRSYDSAGLTPLVSVIGVAGGVFEPIALVRYGSSFASAGSRVAFRAPGRIHVGVGAAPPAISSLGIFSDYDVAFAILDPQFELPSSRYSVAVSSANDQPATVNHCLQVESVCSSSYRIADLSASDASVVNLAPDLGGPEAICFDFTPERVVGAGNRAYVVPVTVADNVDQRRSIEVIFDYSFTEQGEPLMLDHPDGRVDVVALLSADPQVVEWRIAGGADAALFTIDETGELAFLSPPDVDDPQDANANNVYDVVVEVETASGAVFSQVIVITVTGLLKDRFEQPG